LQRTVKELDLSLSAVYCVPPVAVDDALQARINYPWRCLCFAFSQITRTTPRRVMTLHLTQIFLTDALTFIATPMSFQLSAVSCQFLPRIDATWADPPISKLKAES
jgi:hypothetical protein